MKMLYKVSWNVIGILSKQVTDQMIDHLRRQLTGRITTQLRCLLRPRGAPSREQVSFGDEYLTENEKWILREGAEDR